MMNDIATPTETTGSRDLCERVSGLNELGAHYFAGWLISAGFQQPDVMTEVEAVLHEMEADPDLRHWSVPEAPADGTTVATEIIPQPELQTSLESSGETPNSTAVPAPPNPLHGLPTPKTAPARRLPLAARLIATLFPKRRLAA